MNYDELPFWSAPFGILLLETVRIRHGLRVLDIGSGSGFPMLELAGRLGKEGTVYGLDPSPESQAMITEKALLKGISNAFPLSGVAENIPFEDEFFDLITSNNGLNNVQDLRRTLEECHRVLKPGGQLVFTVNLPHTMVEFYSLFEETLAELGLEREKQQMHLHIERLRKPVEYLKELVLSVNLEIRSIQLDGFKFRFASVAAMFEHHLIRTYFLPKWREIVTEEKAVEVFEKVSARLEKLVVTQGFLELSIPFTCFDCTR